MPHTNSAKKRLRQTLKLKAHNRAVKKALRKQLKIVAEVGADKQGTLDQLKKETLVAVKKLDKAAARRILHPNTVARKKSQLARMLNKAAKPPAAAAK